MGFEGTIVVAIFFLTAVILGTTAYVVISASDDMVDDASYEENEMQVKRLQTDIVIDSSTPVGSAASYDLTVNVSNSGSETLRSDELDVLVDGTIQSYTFAPTTITWTPDETKTLTVAGLSGGGPHRVKVITENGISDYDTYSVSV
jgi:flagellar protein FlaF